MMTSAFRAKALSCALLASTALASPALAQSAYAPVRETIDQNNVDLLRGTVSITPTELTIGQEDQGLGFGRFWRGNGFGYSANASLISSGSHVIAAIGPVSDSFTVSGSSFINTEGNGATLTLSGSTYTYTARDGTVVLFTANSNMNGYFANRLGRATQATRPDGQQFDYAYQTTLVCEYWGGGGDFCTGGYKNACRLASVTNGYGYRLSFSYALDDMHDASSLMSWETLTSAKAVNLKVEACNTMQTPCATTGDWPTVSYSGGATTDNAGRTTNYIRTSGRITGVRRPGSSTNDITYTHALSGSVYRVSSVTTHSGTTDYAYSDASGVRTVTVTNPLNQATVYKFNIASERMTSVTDPLNRTTSYQYDGSGRVIRITKPEGNYTQLTYDARGNVTQTQHVAKSGRGDATITTSAAFPSSCTNGATCNSPTSTTDARGKVTDYTYDTGHGGLLTVTLPAPTTGAVRPQTRYTYGSFGTSSGHTVTKLTQVSQCQTNASCAGTADEAKTTIAYTSGNVLPSSVTAAAGNGSVTATTAMAYDDVGNLLTVDGPLAGADDTIRYRYDDIRRPVGTVGPDPDGTGILKHRARRVTYNSPGFVTKVEAGTVDSQSDAHWAAFAPLEQVDISHDGDGRPVRQKLVAGGATHAVTDLSYDDAGRPLCSATRMNPAAWTTATDACTPQTAGGDGPDRITRNVYDAAGQVTQVQAAYGTAAQANEVTATYRQNGQVETVTDAESNKTTYEYDGHDRLERTRFPVATKGANASSTIDYELLGYDAGSNVTSRRLRDGLLLEFYYDALNRLTSKHRPGSEPTVTYAYDNLGRMTGASQTGHALSFTYDALGRNLGQAGPLGTVSYLYDAAGRRTRTTYPGPSLYVDYDYLVTGEMTRIRENGATSGVGLLATFTYDDHGRRKWLTRGNGTQTGYSYDAASRLETLGQDLAGTAHDLELDFAYNPASQIETNIRNNDLYAWTGHSNENTAYTANGLNQLTNVGGTAAAHDAKGNMTNDGLGGSFAYSSENLLTTATIGGQSTALSYDALLRLHAVDPGLTTQFVYDGLDMIAEYDGGNALLRRYVHGPGMDEPIVWYEGAGTTDRRWLHADERGSIVAVTDSSGGLVGVNSYDEYGVPQSTNIGRFQYTGQTWLPEIGLYYYKARMYHPELGLFPQPDPIGYWAGMNLYAYVKNDPVNFVDPTGTTIIIVTGERPKDPCENTRQAGHRCYTPFSLDPGLILPPPHNEPRDGLPDFSFEGVVTTIIEEFAKEAEKAKKYVKGCAAGAGNIDARDLGRDALNDGAQGALQGGARGTLFGSYLGPEGGAAGGLGGAALGFITGLGKGVITSAVTQACSAGNK